MELEPNNKAFEVIVLAAIIRSSQESEKFNDFSAHILGVSGDEMKKIASKFNEIIGNNEILKNYYEILDNI